jgi:hypothetical protein
MASGVHTCGDSAAAGGAAGCADPPADRVAAPVRALLDWLFLPRRALSAMERDLARVQWAQAETLTKLRELKTMTVVITDDTDRAEALSDLWRLRDALSVSDPDLAAQLHAIWNRLVVARPNEDSSEGPDGA